MCGHALLCLLRSKQKYTKIITGHMSLFIVGTGGFQIAAEVLRWSSEVREQSFLPPISVANKYFSLDIQLRLARTVEDAITLVQQGRHSAVMPSAPFGGVIVVSGPAASNKIALLSCPFFVFPDAAVFRAVMLCVEEETLPRDVYDAWVSQCLTQRYELIFHRPLDGTSESFEVIPPTAERRGLLQEELRGSARLLQMLHNTPWMSSSSSSTASQQASTIGPSLLVIGESEKTALELLCSMGVVFSKAKSGEAQRSAARGVQCGVLHWVHAYGHSSASVQFLAAALFSSAMRDLSGQCMSSVAPPAAILFVDDGHLSVDVVSVVLSYFQQTGAPQPETIVWVSTAAVHGAMESALTSRGVEVLSVREDRGERDDDADCGLSGVSRLSELLTIAATPHGENVRETNRILFVSVGGVVTNPLLEATVNYVAGELSSSSDGSAVTTTRVESSSLLPPIVLSLRTKYYTASVDVLVSGVCLGVTKRRAAEFIAKFDAVIFIVADRAICSVAALQDEWMPALGPVDSRCESERICMILDCSESLPRQSGSTFWEEFGEEHCVEVAHGADRLIEALTNTQWRFMQRLDAALPHRDVSSVAPRDAAVTSASPVGVMTNTVSGVNSDDASNDDVIYYSCEPPSTMLVDPETLITLYVAALDPSRKSSSTTDAFGAKKEEALLDWMRKMKTHGHKLRRSDRQRQALLLAETLGETMNDPLSA